jgi:hypothetical protein
MAIVSLAEMRRLHDCLAEILGTNGAVRCAGPPTRKTAPRAALFAECSERLHGMPINPKVVNLKGSTAVALQRMSPQGTV